MFKFKPWATLNYAKTINVPSKKTINKVNNKKIEYKKKELQKKYDLYQKGIDDINYYKKLPISQAWSTNVSKQIRYAKSQDWFNDLQKLKEKQKKIKQQINNIKFK